MLKTKRRRAVVLALIAFFCTAAATYVAVDWKRFGGGILAFFKGSHEEHLASTGASGGGGSGAHSSDVTSAPNHPGLPQVAAAHPRGAKHIGGGTGSGKSGDDLFVYGDPAAGVPAGSFLVASNDVPPLADVGVGSPAPAPGGTPEGGGAAPGGVSGGGGGTSTGSGGGDNGFPGGTPTPAQSPSAPTPAPAPPVSTPAPTPTQSGSTDDPPPSAPTSAIPEASNLAMMSLGALFLAVAAQRRRNNKQG